MVLKTYELQVYSDYNDLAIIDHKLTVEELCQFLFAQETIETRKSFDTPVVEQLIELQDTWDLFDYYEKDIIQWLCDECEAVQEEMKEHFDFINDTYDTMNRSRNW